MAPTVRTARPDDYDRIVAVIDRWWGRPLSRGLPRMFLDHFWSTSQVADDAGGLAGFLVAHIAPSDPAQAYISFVGVRPDQRRAGLAGRFYRDFAEFARRQGCRELRAITAPINTASIRFHATLGFAVSEPVPDYNGAGRTFVVFTADLRDPAVLPTKYPPTEPARKET